MSILKKMTMGCLVLVICFASYYCYATHKNSKANIEQQTVEVKQEKVVPEQKIDYTIYGKGALYLEKYEADKEVSQIILVEQKPSSITEAVLKLFIKDSNSRWQTKLECDAYLGKNGIDKVKEGDARTPSGDFGFTMAFGIKDDPGSKIPYTKVTDSMYCCGDKEYYNKIIDLNKVSHKCTNASEHLIKYQPQYNYCLFVDYNNEGVFGKGSAIFLHVKGSCDYTLGCISVSESDMIELLRSVDEKARICIYSK